MSTAEAYGTLLARVSDSGEGQALQNAVRLWSDSTTHATSFHRADLMRSKRFAVLSFFSFVQKALPEVKPEDVRAWRGELEGRHKPATVYARISRLSSFYDWVMRDPALGSFITTNPARLALPKCPRPYQTERTKALDDEQVGRLLGVVARKAKENVVGKRDYALLLFFVTTGMRRNEVLALRGHEVELKADHLIVHSRVKGGDYVGREVGDPAVRAALLDYLSASGRSHALSSERPLWTRHDRAGKPGAGLTSHAFAKNLKGYAREAGLDHVHIHQTRHTFARMVAEDTGSLTETQDALGHRNLATTRVYVQRIAVKRDKHGRRITARLGINCGGTENSEELNAAVRPPPAR